MQDRSAHATSFGAAARTYERGRPPYPPEAVDWLLAPGAVLVAQAWHWVDPGRAVPEIARVLAPGGRLGVLGNLRDETVDWVRRLGRIIGGADHDRDLTVGPPFGPVETHDFPWTHHLGRAELLDMVASRSHVILLPPDQRAAVRSRVRHLLATHPDLAGRTEYDLPYVTRCARTSLS
jgi:SAM-dependent methyltransferase